MIKNTKDVKIDDFKKIFVAGDYGTGKSVFASSFPKPAFVFDFDLGITTYRNSGFDYSQFPLTALGWVEFEKTLREVRKKVEDEEYTTIIVDSTTTMTDLAMERAMQLDPKRSVTGGPLWNVHYQMVKNLIEGKLRTIVNFDCNIVVIAHLDIVLDAETGAVIKIEPLLTGQLSTKIPGLFDEVYCAMVRMKKGDPEFILRTITKGFYHARSRISGKERLLPDEIENDYGELLKVYKKEGGKER